MKKRRTSSAAPDIGTGDEHTTIPTKRSGTQTSISITFLGSRYRAVKCADAKLAILTGEVMMNKLVMMKEDDGEDGDNENDVYIIFTM